FRPARFQASFRAWAGGSTARVNWLAQRSRPRFAPVQSHLGCDNRELSRSRAGLVVRSRKAWEPPHVQRQTAPGRDPSEPTKVERQAARTLIVQSSGRRPDKRQNQRLSL